MSDLDLSALMPQNNLLEALEEPIKMPVKKTPTMIITARLPPEVILKIAKKLRSNDIRHLFEAIQQERYQKTRARISSISVINDELVDLIESLRFKTHLEADIKRMSNKVRGQEIAEEFNAYEKRRGDRRARDTQLQHPFYMPRE